MLQVRCHFVCTQGCVSLCRIIGAIRGEPSVLDLTWSARTEEQLYYRLGTLHNLRFMLRLAADLRAAIIAGTYPAFRTAFLERYVPASEQTREIQRAKWQAARRQKV